MANKKTKSSENLAKKSDKKDKKESGITIFEENIKKVEDIDEEPSDQEEEIEEEESKSFMIKLVLIGDGAVGKTSIRQRYLGKGFPKEHLATLGADFAVIDKEVGPHSVKYQIWDVAGQEFFKRVRARFYRGCFGALTVFDITRRDTFLNISKWLDELYEHNGRGVVPVILLANKSDLEEKEVTIDEANEFISKLNEKTKEHNIENFFLETSALTGLNIEKAFEIIGEYIVKNYGAK